MSQIDLYHQETLRELLSEDWEPDNRAVWEDGTPVMTKRIPFVIRKYDLSKEFPAPTIRGVNIKSLYRENDWIYRTRSNNVNDFKGKIWDSWADESGSIGSAYGAQVAKGVFGYDNQMDYILEEIKKNPTNRRLVIEMWNVDDIKDMNLPPCAHHLQFVVKDGKINLLLKQRSQDFIVANFWNVGQYALLLHMVARHTGYEVGILTHVIGDCHIYNKHEDIAKELLNRQPKEASKLWINPEVKDFYEFTEDDFELVDYNPHPQIKGIDVAI